MKGSPLKEAMAIQEKKDAEKRVVDIWSRETVEPPKNKIAGKQDTQPTQPIIPNQPNVSNLTNPTKPIAPEKDFTKTPNSIARVAVPERIFKGMSKNTYDALYLKTRGAVNPIRRIRATKSDLLRWTGVSDVTIDKHIRHLKSVGLLKVEFCIGSHDGNWYEVFIPEETDTPNLPNQPNLPKKVGGETPNLVGGVGGVELIENKEVTENLKTSFKDTNTIDDEQLAFSSFVGAFAAASRNLTGKGISGKDRAKWQELADVLIAELESAAANAKTISNVPAFLVEHLRRRLSAKPSPSEKTAIARRSGENAAKVSDSVEPYEAEPLTEAGRETVLNTLREKRAKGENIDGLKDLYSAIDWKWLMRELGK